MDLENIMMEYESYYYLKFGKKPKFVSTVKDEEKSNSVVRTSNKTFGNTSTKRQSESHKRTTDAPQIKRQSESLPPIPQTSPEIQSEKIYLTGHSFHKPILAPSAEPASTDQKLPKPMPVSESSEINDLALTIQRDIFIENPNVKWTDIIGLQTSKRLLKESIIFPLKYPEFFTGILRPWKGLLLYGPPGTGKTMVIKFN
jgi:katanin p60 ATPase-containing subunit A1